MTLVNKLDALPLAVAEIHRHIGDGPDAARAEDAGVRSIGGHSDPTGERAVALAATHERLLEDIEANLATLALAAGNLVDEVNRWVMSAANREEHPRCTGGSGVEAWTRPDCTEFVMHRQRDDGTYSYNRDGLCWGCYQRRRRYHQELLEQGAG